MFIMHISCLSLSYFSPVVCLQRGWRGSERPHLREAPPSLPADPRSPPEDHLHRGGPPASPAPRRQQQPGPAAPGGVQRGGRGPGQRGRHRPGDEWHLPTELHHRRAQDLRGASRDSHISEGSASGQRDQHQCECRGNNHWALHSATFSFGCLLDVTLWFFRLNVHVFSGGGRCLAPRPPL